MDTEGPPASSAPSSAPPPPSRPHGALYSFTHARTFAALVLFRDYRLLWLGQSGNTIGQWMDQVTRSWLMYELTGSALQLGLVSAARAIPMLFFSVLAGAVADRYGRKRQLVISQVVNAGLNVLLAALVLTQEGITDFSHAGAPAPEDSADRCPSVLRCRPHEGRCRSRAPSCR